MSLHQCDKRNGLLDPSRCHRNPIANVDGANLCLEHLNALMLYNSGYRNLLKSSFQQYPILLDGRRLTAAELRHLERYGELELCD